MSKEMHESNDIHVSFENLKKVGGYQALQHYPFKSGMNFQFVDFPSFVTDGTVDVLGNNQAFNFVRNPKGNIDPDKMVLDTAPLKSLLKNIYMHNTRFRMRLDADVIANPEHFVEKYHLLRGEPEVGTKKALLRKEAELISEFVKEGGIPKLARKVISEASGKNTDVDAKLHDFLQNNFQLLGVKVQEPIEGAVWSAEGSNGTFVAKQIYSPGTHNVERSWQLGSREHLETLMKDEDHSGAKEIIEAVQHMLRLPTVNYTLGGISLNKSAEKGKER